jgi:hypothetical protein
VLNYAVFLLYARYCTSDVASEIWFIVMSFALDMIKGQCEDLQVSVTDDLIGVFCKHGLL